MANERGHNKRKREKKRIERIRRLLGMKLCACGVMNGLQCRGLCKERHTNSKTGKVECGEMYQIDYSDIKQSDLHHPKRDWKYGRQKEGNENKLIKQQRREKMERDRS